MAVEEVPDADAFRREVLEPAGPMVVAFWAEWCPFCRRFRPWFERAHAARGGRFLIARLDDEGNPLWEDFRVAVVPTVAVFREGRVAARRDGILGRGISEAELAAFLDATLTTRPA